MLAQVVRDWVGRVMPGEKGAVDAAVAAALRSFAGGASFAEACEEAHRLAGCWSRHPSRPVNTHRALVAVS
jgi:hypothetical protein